MNDISMESRLSQIGKAFRIEGSLSSFEEIKVGNVNRTYRLNYTRPGENKDKSYMVQRINTYAFKQPTLVMENIDKVTEHIRKKCPDKQSLHFYHTADGKNYLEDDNGFWRMFNYVPSITYNSTDNLTVIRNAGQAFGDFQMQLGDFDVSQLNYTIPDFHDTRKRYAKFRADASADPCGKAKEVQREIDWLLSVEDKACLLTDMLNRGELPLRVTHNDTKINNVLFSESTNEALVVIDLDTVMPGLVGHDFGDAIRFAANYVDEDCRECEKAGVNMDVFRAFTEGFMGAVGGTLTDNEIDTLAMSSFALGCELATRFLDDYLLGNPYFNIDYPEHNLVRTKCQIALAQDMLKKMDDMNRVVHEFANK